MGLLSDPSLMPRNKLGRSLAKHSRKICILFYVCGLAWFGCLAHSDFNHGTYLSENALSPGLVYPEVKVDSSRLAQTLVEELQRERIEHKSTTPHAWILAKMQQIGLETHVHNFTLRYPFAGGKEFQGKNVYGILRAPRIGSTEGIVFSAPYRAVTSVHTDIVASVPLLLAFADFARKKNYWAKDLIFLVTEQEQLGMHAWLEAYHEGGIKDSSILNCGNLPARAGSLQAALNLEIQDLDIDYIDVKIEGLNGQLPNLDMFNLVQRITSREGISSGYKQTPRKKRRITHTSVEENLMRMASMLVSQATGVPNGNHGLFHRYRIESLTLEAVKRTANTNNNDNQRRSSVALLKTVEGISRSLNNLLERFHQSYFFYILVQNDRFVSIGDFMPCLILLAAPMFMKAFLLWLTITDGTGDGIADDLQSQNEGVSEVEEEETDECSLSTAQRELQEQQLPFTAVLLYVGAAVGVGLLCQLLSFNTNVRENFATLGWSIATTTGVLLTVTALLAIALPLLPTSFAILPAGGIELLHIGVLIFLGVALVVVGLLNFALGFALAIIAVPLAIWVTTDRNVYAARRSLTLLYTLALNPLVVVYLIVFVLTLLQFPELALREVAVRAVTAAADAITFALVDCIIYGNWLYTVITAVFLPLWTLLWTVAYARSPQDGSVGLAKKTN